MAYPLPTDFFQLHWFLPSRFCHPPTTSLIRSRPTDQVWRTGWTRKKSRISLSTHLKLVIVFSTHHKLAYSNDCHWLEFVLYSGICNPILFSPGDAPLEVQIVDQPDSQDVKEVSPGVHECSYKPKTGAPKQVSRHHITALFFWLIFVKKFLYVPGGPIIDTTLQSKMNAKLCK